LLMNLTAMTGPEACLGMALRMLGCGELQYLLYDSAYIIPCIRSTADCFGDESER
jgi:hypothetical protein